MPPKKTSLSLHVSLARINAERATMVIRTQNRITLLHATVQKIMIAVDADEDETVAVR